MNGDENEDFRVGGEDMWNAYAEVIRTSIRKNPEYLEDYLKRHNDLGFSKPETKEEFLRRHKFTEEEIPGILAKNTTV